MHSMDTSKYFIYIYIYIMQMQNITVVQQLAVAIATREVCLHNGHSSTTTRRSELLLDKNSYYSREYSKE